LFIDTSRGDNYDVSPVAQSENGPVSGLMETVQRARRIQTGALMIALITAGALITVPLPFSPVPIVLQNMFVVTTGVFLPPAWAFLTLMVYLAMGAVGLPVFAGATGGLAHFAGPTGGFLAGFVLSAWVVSLILHRPGKEGYIRHHLQVAAILTGMFVPYLTGVPWLAAVTGLSFNQAFLAGVIPFLPGDAVKALVLILFLHRLPESLWRRLK
jgi:biotin transport system substrate-specific component